MHLTDSTVRVSSKGTPYFSLEEMRTLDIFAWGCEVEGWIMWEEMFMGIFTRYIQSYKIILAPKVWPRSIMWRKTIYIYKKQDDIT